MAKINWKLRFKNKYTLVALVSAVALFANNITQAFGVDYSAQIEQTVSVVTSIITILAGVGIVVDPTTKGATDTPIVDEYNAPRDASNPQEHVEWVSNAQEKQNQAIEQAGQLTPKDYDTTQPFTDNDTVKYDERIYTNVPTEKESDK